MPDSTHTTPRLVKVALLTGFLATAITGAEFALLKQGVSPAHQLAVAIGPAPIGPLSLMAGSGQIASTPVTITAADGTTYQVLDAVPAGTARYLILFTEKRPMRSDVFFQTESGALTQLTDSETAKYGLSYAPATEAYMFQSKEVSKDTSYLTDPEWSINFAASSTTAPKKIATGVHAYLLPAGNAYLLRTADSLTFNSLQDSSATPVKLMDLDLNSLLAVGTQAGGIAFYNSVTNVIDTYTYSPSGALSFAISYTPSYAPTALAYVGKELLVAGVVQEGTTMTYKIEDLLNNNRVVIEVPDASLQQQIVAIKEL